MHRVREQQSVKFHSGVWAAQLSWERKFTTWQMTQLQVGSVVRLFPAGFKNKRVHTSSLYVIIGLQLAHVLEREAV